MITQLSDIELINNIKSDSNSSDSLEELMDRHSGVYMQMVGKYTRNFHDLHIFNAATEEKGMKFYTAALKFDPEKGCKFSTFIGEEARWVCLTLLDAAKKNNKRFSSGEFDYNRGVDADVFCHETIEPEAFQEDNENTKRAILNAFLQKIEESNDERVKKIFALRYSNEKKNVPWKIISKELGLSIQGCINIHNRTLKKIAKTLKLSDATYV